MAQQTIEVDSYAPKRTPLQPTATLSTTEINLGATIADESDVYWELVCAASWFVGTSTGQLRPVAANEVYNVPSRSLDGWYARAGSGTPTLIATGARRTGS